ncbi:hypothetical protein ACSNOK_28115 [Streptomyces sp. URMC 126]|uniref:hypothetical protein n=1 Tax=Streptomyces sp. URMC 126 TaxID=3423401 RepID=UPI003F1B5EEE
MPEPLHFVGLTYEQRGLSYWWRRVLLSLFWLFLTVLSGGMTVGFAYGFAEVGRGVLIAFLVVYALLSCYVGYRSVVKIRKADRYGVMSVDDDDTRPGGGSAVGTAASLGSGCAQALVVFAAPVVFGGTLPHLIRSFGRYTIGERYERRQLGLED